MPSPVPALFALAAAATASAATPRDVAFQKITPTGEYWCDGINAADLDGDGLQDVVTGKRRWAHGPKGDVEPMATPVNYAFLLRRDPQAPGGAKFTPKLIDDASALGTQVTAVDVNGDGVPDVLTASKLGAFVFLTKRQ